MNKINTYIFCNIECITLKNNQPVVIMFNYILIDGY